MRKLIFSFVVLTSTLIITAQDMTNPNSNTTLAEKENLQLTQEWDKVFDKSDKVNHKKITFVTRYGITLAADMYTPKNATDRLAAIAICGPFGAVKEQSSGLYAQQLAERGFLTIAFDPSFTGESGGMPRRIASPDINTEDFEAAVDFLSTQPNVDPHRIGILGICGWGGMAISAAANDPRIKATVACTMYNMSRVTANGYNDVDDNAEARYAQLQAMSAQRSIDYKNGYYKRAGGVVDPLPDDAPLFVKEYFAYYKTPRGYHVRSGNSNDGWNATSFLPFINFSIGQRAAEIKNAVMLVHGDKAHSLYFSQDTFKDLIGDNKEFLIVADANHVDLYDNLDKIPFEQIAAFFRSRMPKKITFYEN
ncbi:MAG: alpha/beta hydrolase [Muribaculaceae bacterium]|nr:alpha/beta hydrolase [Muribaculaceae bacterium]